MPRLPRVLVNAMHASTGGGVVYLAHILPELAKEAAIEWVVLLPEGCAVEVPKSMELRTIKPFGFVKGHLWEQLVLPVLCRKWRISAVLCNANYVPLLAPKPMPVVHSTVRAGLQASGLKMRMYWRILRVLTRLSLWRAPVAFSVARHVVGDYVGGVKASGVRVAPPGVSVADADNGVVREGNLVAAVGDFYAQKDYPTLLRAFARLRAHRKETRLLIMGKAVDPAVRDDVLALVRELKLGDAVTMTGAVPHAMLMKTLAKADVYVSTSLAETVQMPLLEAMALGVPVVAARAPHSEEFVGEAGVLVDVAKGGDIPAAFGMAIYGILENPAIAGTLARMGRERAANYTWEATGQVLVEGVRTAIGVRQ